MRSARLGRPLPLVRETAVPADPLSAARAAGFPRTSFLLESQTAHEASRHSYVGLGPFARIVLNADGTIDTVSPSGARSRTVGPLDGLLRRSLLRTGDLDGILPPFVGGVVGYLAYEFGHLIEPLRRILSPADSGRPLAEFLLVDRLVAIDHKAGRAWAIANPWVGPEGPARLADPARAFDQAERALLEDVSVLSATAPGDRLSPNPCVMEILHHPERERYVRQVLAVKSYIAAGDIYQANISNRYVIAHNGFDPVSLYASLRTINPSPFGALFATPERTIVSNSPERLFRVSGTEVEARPIAGTRPRGVTEEADRSLARELFLSEKERAEHVMLVDLARNDLGRVCRTGSVHVNEFMACESYSHVHHIVSNVRGILRPDRDALDALGALFPGGTITGVPKIRCREIIAEIEGRPRDIYTGSLGYVSTSGDADFNILIRSADVTRDRISFSVGAGIVADSDPDKEFHEIQHKAGAFLAAVDALIRKDARREELRIPAL
ncbi:MAG: hypothetical protein A2V83_05930 [Nitrospirae bacterium RBG_16_64_22]|nr:MAG: hypothetical protein A2V83_05930 [Nitrospirae bacterium RBG_16_64_22]